MTSQRNADWEYRVEQMCKPEFFKATINVSQSSLNELGLSLDEFMRLQYKLRLIEESAVKQALAMLKGTLKYDTDDRTPDEWAAFEEEEDIDRFNYNILKRDARNKEVSR